MQIRRAETVDAETLAKAESETAAAIRLYESFGFVHEGRLSKRIRLTDGCADDICMGLFVDSAEN